MKKYLALILIYIFSIQQVSASLYISSVMPNTTNDTNLEYVEITNSGTGKIDLNGYKLKDKSNKTFDFGYGEYIDSNDSQKYYRPKTKIILNNTNEKVFLYDNFGNLIDEVNYSSSTKGQEIVFHSQNQTNSGNINNGNNNSNSGSTNSTNTGTTNSGITNSGTTNSGIIIPNIIYEFQNPSYITDKTPGKEKYLCDTSKDECKLNLNLEKSFSGSITESQYTCKIDFGLKGWFTGEENKCNPNTIIFPKGIYTIKLQIISKQDPTKFSEKSFILENSSTTQTIEKEKIIYKTHTVYKTKEVCSNSNSSSSGNSNSNVNSNDTNGKNTGNYSEINIKNPLIKIQSGIKNGKCTNPKKCSVNLIYEPKNKNEACIRNFGVGIWKSKDNNKRCNPSYVYFPNGTHKISLKVYDKYHPDNYKITYLNFSNIAKNKKSKVDNKVDKQSIIIDNNKQEFGYKKEKQVDNVDKTTDNQDQNLEENLISFLKQNSNSGTTNKNKANSGILKQDTKQNIGNTKKLNQAKDQITYFSDSIFNKKINLTNKYSSEVKIPKTYPKIVIQGKLGKNKILKGNILTCKGTCSVNFNLDGVNKKDIKEIFWDFGNSKTYKGINPYYVKYTKFGKYKVTTTILLNSGEKITKFFEIIYKPKSKMSRKHKSKKLKAKKKKTTYLSKSKNPRYIKKSEISNSYIPKDKINSYCEAIKFTPEAIKKYIMMIYVLIFFIALMGGFILLQRRKVI